MEIIETTKKWKARNRLSHVLEREAKIQWIPGHDGVKEHDLADFGAKEVAAKTPPDPLQHLTFSSLKL